MMKNKYMHRTYRSKIFLFLFLMCSLFAFPQKSNEITLDDKLLSLRKKLLSQPKETIPELKALAEKSNLQNNPYIESYCYSTISLGYYVTQDYDNAMSYSNKAISLSSENNFKDIEGPAKGIKAMIFYDLSFLDQAKDEIQSALKLLKGDTPKILEAKFKTLTYATQVYNRNEPSTFGINKEALVVAEKLNDKSKITTALTNLGYLYMDVKKDYPAAMKHFKRSLKLVDKNDTYTTANIEQNIGNLYLLQKKGDSAIYYLEKALKILKGKNRSPNELEINKLLKQAYILEKKSTKAIEKSLEIDILRDYVNSEAGKAYPKVVKEIVDDKTKDVVHTKKNAQLALGIALVLLIILGIFLLKNYRKSKKEYINYQKIIDKLQNQEPLISAPVVSNSITEKTTFSVPSDKEIEILKKLDKFEKSEGFKNKNLSLSSMAESLGTNTAYLSTVINANKNKNFNQYINELRIDYIIYKLRNDPQYLKYKISHLAEECGFSSHNTFTVAFSNFAGVSPSNFVKFLSQENT